MYTIRLLPIAGLVMLLTSCGQRSSGKAESDSDSTEQTAVVTHKLMLPKPPVMLADSVKLEFMASHYWDHFDFADTTWIADTAALEQTFADWTGLLTVLPEAKAAGLGGGLIRKAGAYPDMLLRLAEVAEHYWQDPNSPFRSEELYIPVLEALITAPGVADIYKIRPRAQLESALKNRPGMKAADFAYTTGSGRTGRLSQLRGVYTLLMFYNPDCHDCARVEQHIAHSELFAPLIASGRMAMLAVYVDEDLAAWRKHLPQMPAGWTVGSDPGQQITGKGLYALPAIPNLYLLDRNKRVILKDAPVERIEVWLEQNAK